MLTEDRYVSIKMFTELLQAKLGEKDQKFNKYLNIIDGESNRLRRLIDNILDAGKIEKGLKSYKLEKIELNDILLKMVDEIRHHAYMKKQTIDFNNSAAKYYVNGDADAVERAVINLLTNSIKYSDEYTTIEVSILNKDGFTGVKVKDSPTPLWGSRVGVVCQAASSNPR